MILHRAKFSSTEFNYALDLNSFTAGNHSARMKALWFKNQNGWVIHEGNVEVWGQGSVKTIEEFLDKHDGKYNGNTEFKWNGLSMWYNDSYNRFLPQLDAYNRLDPILKEFNRTFEESKKPGAIVKNNPQVPAGYSGWFSVKSKK